MKKLAYSLVVLSASLLIVVGLYASLRTGVSAQDDPIVIPLSTEGGAITIPLSTPTPPDIEYLSPADLGYNVAFFTADLDNPITTQIQDAMNATVVSDWSGLISFATTVQLDGLIIDSSVRELVDTEWLGNAYRDGLVVARMGMHPVEGAQLLNSSCAELKAQGIIPAEFEETFANQLEDEEAPKSIDYSFQVVHAMNPEMQGLAEELYHSECAIDINTYPEVGTVYTGERDASSIIPEGDLLATTRMAHRFTMLVSDVYAIRESHEVRMSGIQPTHAPSIPTIMPTMEG